jgi:hypothetical protein
VRLSNGELNNSSNPQAAVQLDLALGQPVRDALNDALSALGDWTGDEATGPSVGEKGKGVPGTETTIGSGSVVVIGDDHQVKSVPMAKAPKALQDALSNGVMNGLPKGH